MFACLEFHDQTGFFLRKIIRRLPWILLAIDVCINIFGYGAMKIEVNGEKCTISTGKAKHACLFLVSSQAA